MRDDAWRERMEDEAPKDLVYRLEVALDRCEDAEAAYAGQTKELRLATLRLGIAMKQIEAGERE